MKTQLIAEIGSTHGNSKEYMRHAVQSCYDHGAWLKVQLFSRGSPQDCNGNIPLSREILAYTMGEAIDKDVKVVASMWELLWADVYESLGGEMYKVAYSARHNNGLITGILERGCQTFISQQHIDSPIDGTIRMLCIPEYPVYGTVSLECIGTEFDGFSDHTVGITQSLRAIDAGALYIEKHVAFYGYAECPDARFAINEDEFEDLAEACQ